MNNTHVGNGFSVQPLLFAPCAGLSLRREKHLQNTFVPSYIGQQKQLSVVSSVSEECSEQD